MAFRKILVPIGGGDATPWILKGALLFAGATGAHINALHVHADIKEAMPLLGDGMSGSMIEEMMDLAEEDSAERARRSREKFDAFVVANAVKPTDEPLVGDDQITASLTFAEGREDELVSRLGKVSDLVICSRPNPDSDRPPLVMVHAAIFETGKPVLLLPLAPVQQMGTHVLIAWSATAEGARAVNAALPLLERADKVTIVTVGMENSPIQESAKDLADHLVWHGVYAVVESPPADRPAGEVISEMAKFHGCDLIVMGAFTRSRLIQIILGGVTQHMMNTSEIPILMSH